MDDKLYETRVAAFYKYEVKRMLHGIRNENMHDVLMKTMCSNHSNTLLQPLKLPSCNSDKYEGRKWRNCTKLGWHDRPWRECQEYHQFQCLYAGLCWSCDHVLKWPWPCLQHSGASRLLINFLWKSPWSVGNKWKFFVPYYKFSNNCPKKVFESFFDS